MNKNNLKTVLTHIKEFVKNSRPAYKDYLGEETVTTPGKTLMTGTLAENGELTLVDTSFTDFVVGKTYQVTVGDVTGEYVGQNMDNIAILASFDITTASESMPADLWVVVVVDSGGVCSAQGTYIGQTITVSTLPTTTVEKKYDVKKLSEDLLPDKTVKDISNLKSRFNSHASDTTRHITSDDRNAWDNAYIHSQDTHAPTNAEKNQNAFSYVNVGSTSISADSSTDTLTLAAGNNITLTPDSSNDKVTFSVADASVRSKGVVQLTDSTVSTSITTAATPNSVKSVYDLANQAKTAASTAQSTADAAQSTADAAKTAASKAKEEVVTFWNNSPWKQSNITSDRFNNVLYANGIWVTSTYSGSTCRGIYYSTDGKTWTQSNITANSQGVYYANGVWVANGNIRSTSSIQGIYYSTDGKTWTQSNITSGDFSLVKYVNGLWLGCLEITTNSATEGIYYSTDGKTWTQSNITSGDFGAIAYANGVWVAKGNIRSTSNSIRGIYYSTDGKTWTQSNITSWEPDSFAYANGVWVISNRLTGYEGIYYSTDGKTWTQSNFTSGDLGAIAYANGIWVACSYDSTYEGIYYSTDGKTWTQSNKTSSTYGLCYLNDIWLTKDGYYSTDGKTWTQNNITSWGPDSFAYANGVWVGTCTGSNAYYKGIYYSTDGKTWTQSNITSDYFGNAHYANGMWMLLSRSNTLVGNDGCGIYCSADGKFWVQSNITSGVFSGISYHDGIWIAQSDDSKKIYYLEAAHPYTEYSYVKALAKEVESSTLEAAKTDFDSHTANTTLHITSTERTNWNAAKTHADSAHAPSNAEKNQNAFSNVVVGSTTIAADSATDTLTLAGSNVTITPDATNDKVTIGITKANVTSALGYTPPTTDTTYTSLKNPYAVTIQANGTSLGTYDGSAAKTFNITPSNIGSYTKAEIDAYSFITTDDIDTICGQTIVNAAEVTF